MPCHPACPQQTDSAVFNAEGYITIELGHITQTLHRIYRTAYFLLTPAWLRRTVLQIKKHSALYNKKTHNKKQHRHILFQAYQLATKLPQQTLPILESALGVKLFGETAQFDHLDFALWMNKKPDNLSGDWTSYLYDKHAELLYAYANTETMPALELWLNDLSLLAEFLTEVKNELTSLSGLNAITVEHAHLKSWQPKGYKAQWWHIDRGNLSAIATVAGPSTTEFVLKDPAPYPHIEPGFDAFVFPEQLNQPIYRVPPQQLLICGGRERKELGQSYLWHRAPISKSERLVLVIKTLRSQQEKDQKNPPSGA